MNNRKYLMTGVMLFSVGLATTHIDEAKAADIHVANQTGSHVGEDEISDKQALTEGKVTKAPISQYSQKNVITPKSGTRSVTAKDIGMVNDGKTDNTAALQAWLNTCKNYTSNTLTLDKGTYVFDKGNAILMASNVNIVGQGDTTQFYFTKWTAFHYPSQTAGYDGGIQNVTWKNMKFKGHQPTTVHPTITNYGDGSKLVLNTDQKNTKNEQIGRAQDNIKVTAGKEYTASLTYQTSDSKSTNVTVQMQTESGAKNTWESVNIKPIADGKPHTISVTMTLKSNVTSFYAGTRGEFNGTISNCRINSGSTINTSENLVGASNLNGSGWRFWLPTADFLCKNKAGYALLPNGPVDIGAITQSLLHAKNISYDNLTFEDVQSQTGHLFDVDGSTNINITNCRMKGFGNRVGIADMNKESIQVDYANYGAMSWHQAGDVYDGIATHHINISNNEFLPIKNADNTIRSFAPNPAGEHVTQSIGNPQTFIHDIKFDNNIVLDALPAKSNYYQAITDGVTQMTTGQWGYAGHAVLHFPNATNLAITNNQFENDQKDEIKTDGYVRIMAWDKGNLKHSGIDISNNTFGNIYSDKPLIDFSCDGSRADIAGTTYDDVLVENNTFNNPHSSLAANNLVRNYGIDQKTGVKNDHVTINGTFTNNVVKQVTTATGARPYTDKFRTLGAKIKCVDEKGKVLKTTATTYGPYAMPINAKSPSIPGYRLVTAAPNNAVYDVFGKDKELTATYAPITSSVTIKFVDENGASIANNKVVSGQSTTGFNFDAPTLAHYQLDSVTGADVNGSKISGTFGDDNKVVTVHYKAEQISSSIKVYDDTTGKALGSHNLKDKYGTKIDTTDIINGLKAGRYDIVSDNANGKSLATNGQVFEIHVKHHIEAQADQTKSVKQTIKYTTANGTKVADNVQSLTFKRAVKKDMVTGAISYGTWSGGQTFKDVASPTVKGQTPDKAVVKGASVTNTSADRTVTVTYGLDNETATVKIHDKTANKDLPEQTVKGKYGEKIDLSKIVADLKAKGYDVVTPEASNYDEGVNNISLTVSHHMTVQANDTKSVKQTIKYVTADKSEVKDNVQSVTFTRSTKKDLVTGEVIYGTWSSAQTFKDVTSPTVKGQTPDKAVVKGASVANDAKDSTVTVTYALNDESATVKIHDKTANKDLAEQTVKGKYGEKIDLSKIVADLKAKGYDVVTPEASTYDEGDNTISLSVKHHMTKQADDTKSVKQTIKYVTADKSILKDNVQSLIFKRSATKDMVTGEVSYGAWSGSQKFNDVTSPKVKGQTPDKATVKGTDVANDAKDSTVTVTYAFNDEVAKIKIHDKTANKDLAEQTVKGKYGEKIDLSKIVADLKAKGYDVAAPEESYFDDGGTIVSLSISHHMTKQADDTKSVKQTIKYVTADKSEIKDNVQSVTFKRSTTKDMVTGDIKYGTWSGLQKFSDVKSPEVRGETPDKDTVAGGVVVNDDKDKVVTVTYHLNNETAKVAIHDATINKDLPEQTLKGKYGQKIDLSAIVAKLKADGYDVTVPKDSNYDEGNNDVKLIVKHHMAAQADDTKSVKQTIKYVTADKSEVKDNVQKVTFKRSVTKDMVTGDINYGTWSGKQTFNDVNSPKVKGETPDKAIAKGAGVIDSDKDVNVVVRYQLNDEVAHVTVHDKTVDKDLPEQTVKGKYGEVIDLSKIVAGLKAKGYDVKVTEIKFAEGDNKVTLTAKHRTEAQDDDVKTIKRTIHFEGVNHKDVVQEVTFKRSATKDMVTGDISYGDWPKAQEFERLDLPSVSGYQTKDKVDALTVSPDDKDSELTVHYTKVDGNSSDSLSSKDSDSSSSDSSSSKDTNDSSSSDESSAKDTDDSSSSKDTNDSSSSDESSAKDTDDSSSSKDTNDSSSSDESSAKDSDSSVSGDDINKSSDVPMTSDESVDNASQSDDTVKNSSSNRAPSTIEHTVDDSNESAKMSSSKTSEATATSSTKNQKALPQAGEKRNWIVSALGVVVLGLTGLWAKFKSKNN